MAVLLVDDCPADLERLEDLLRDIFDDEVFVGASFEEGVELIEWLPDVSAAVFDNMLGDGLGIDLAARLVAKFPSCAPVVMSDYPLREHVNRWLALRLPGMLSAKSLCESAVQEYKHLADEYRETGQKRVTLYLDDEAESGSRPVDARDLVLAAQRLTVDQIVEAAFYLAEAWELETNGRAQNVERTLVASLVEPLGKRTADICCRPYDSFRRDRTDVVRAARMHDGYDGPRDVDIGVLLLAASRANYERLIAERRAGLGLERKGPVKVRDDALRAELQALLERSRGMRPIGRHLAALAEADPVEEDPALEP